MVAHTSAGAHTDVHAPKHETFDLVAKTNVDPKGFVRVVDEYRVEPWGLYMARPSDHAHFDYLESWLLPALGLRASVFHYLPAHARDQDYYVDIGEYTAGASRWTSVDHYLDLSVRTGRDYDLLDVDELFDARVAQHLDTPTAERALSRSIAAIEGLTRHDYDLNAWLASIGMPTEWNGKPA
jgi:predicted RNA-binding protein associated with RNAse of E/G family